MVPQIKKDGVGLILISKSGDNSVEVLQKSDIKGNSCFKDRIRT